MKIYETTLTDTSSAYAADCSRVSKKMISYELGNVLGAGSFGTVYEVKEDPTLVVKKIRRTGLDTETNISYTMKLLEFREMTNREIKLNLCLAQTTAVVKLVDMVENDDEVWLIFERMDMTLHKFMREVKFDPVNIAYKLIKCVETMHASSIAHRDIKPQNILVSIQPNDTNDISIKLCDLGMAKQGNHGCFASSEKHTDYVTTRWYRAPELICGYFDGNMLAIDMWSVGCIIVELFTGKPIFPGKNGMHQVNMIGGCLGYGPHQDEQQFLSLCPLTKGVVALRIAATSSFNDKPPHTYSRLVLEGMAVVNAEACDLVLRLLTYNPKIRLSASNALDHCLFMNEII